MVKRWFFLLLFVPTFATPAEAGIFFGRKKETIDIKVRVPELITALKTDRNPDRRARAAEELRNYDAQLFPDIIPALIGALKSDPKSNVRTEAAQSLGKIRPVNQPAGEALEQAVAADPAMRVRLQARSALMQYHWAGYRNGKKTDVPPLGTSREPPLAGDKPQPPLATPATPPGIYPLPSPNPRRIPTTSEPPLAPAEVVPAPAPRSLPTPAAPPLEMKPISSPAYAPAGSRPAPMPAGPGPELP